MTSSSSSSNKRKRDANDNLEINKDTPVIERKIKKRRKNISKVIKDLVLERQGVRCNICNILWNSCFELDHIIPRSIGGTDEQDNLQFLCNSCHKYKTYKIDQITREKIDKKIRISKSRIVSSHRKKYIDLMGSNIERKREEIKNTMINSIYGIINDLKDVSSSPLSPSAPILSLKNNSRNSSNNVNNVNNINNTIDLSNIDNIENNIDSIQNKDFDDINVYNHHLNNQIHTDRQLDSILGKMNIIIENYNNFNTRREKLTNQQNQNQNQNLNQNENNFGNRNILNKIKRWITSIILHI